MSVVFSRYHSHYVTMIIFAERDVRFTSSGCVESRHGGDKATTALANYWISAFGSEKELDEEWIRLLRVLMA